jgi:hypothetical protein
MGTVSVTAENSVCIGRNNIFEDCKPVVVMGGLCPGP